MAKKDDKKVTSERTYTIPLRREFLKVPRYKRAKKAVTAVKEFLMKHMKGEDVKLGIYLNKELWKHGIKNPPHHVKVIAEKDEEGVVTAELLTTPKQKEAKRKIKEKLVTKKVEEAEGGVEGKLEDAVEEPAKPIKQE